jgi:PKHD-type hydroxylase
VDEELAWRPSLSGEPSPPYRSCEVHAKAFTVRQCDRILELCRSIEADDAVLETGTGDEVGDDGIRQSRIGWITPSEESWWIFERLGRVAMRANERYRLDLTGFDEDLQFTVYEPGSFYSWHQDGLDGRVGRRKLSLVLQLSDPADYDGGELELFDVVEDSSDEELVAFHASTAERGTAVVFPAFEYHRVQPLRRGIRHSLVAWVSGPPFR